MTSRERKIIRLKRLLADLDNDLGAVGELSFHIKVLHDEIDCKHGILSDRDVMLMAAYLHHFYTGLEAIFERISQEIDGGMEKRGDYHRELLRSMTTVIDGVRPRVITTDFAGDLDDYRRFRHIFRHAYAGELRWKKMNHLAENINTIFDLLKTNLKGFNLFVSNLINQLERVK